MNLSQASAAIIASGLSSKEQSAAIARAFAAHAAVTRSLELSDRKAARAAAVAAVVADALA